MDTSSVYYENLPKKRMAVGVLFFNAARELLIVKPTYQNHWSIPGGVIDADESLRQACLREVREELHLEIDRVRLLAVDYMSPAASEYANKSENLQFIFFGGTLDPERIQGMRLPEKELAEYKFGKLEDVLPFLGSSLANRVMASLRALEKDTAVYLENGELV